MKGKKLKVKKPKTGPEENIEVDVIEDEPNYTMRQENSF